MYRLNADAGIRLLPRIRTEAIAPDFISRYTVERLTASSRATSTIVTSPLGARS
jgi:hypothetical protein